MNESRSPLRIYADFNGLVAGPHNRERTAVVLDTFGSLRDLSNAGCILVDGLPLIAFDWSDDQEDIEGHGVARYDRVRRWWVVEFDEEGVRDVPAGDRSPVTAFRCVACQTDLASWIESNGLKLDDRCPRCDTLIHAAIAPPE